MKRAYRWLLFAASIALLTGCEETFDRLSFASGQTPVPVVVTYDAIAIPEGVAVLTVASPMSGSSVMSSDTEVELTSTDPAVLGVAFAMPENANSGTDASRWSFVLMGIKAGKASLTVRVNGDDKKQIPATIDPQ